MGNQAECNGHALGGPVDTVKNSVHQTTKEIAKDQVKDPVHDICPNLEVKIADLGNACWEVSMTA